VQPVDATLEAYLPLRQILQSSLPLCWVASPVLERYLPTEQFAQVVWPVLAMYLPAEQTLQLDLPCDGWTLPEAQDKQSPAESCLVVSVAESARYLPVPHKEQLVPESADVEYLPEGQMVHWVETVYPVPEEL
jgi:hypothetical protein